jgi:hypothetical protein
MKRTCSVCQRSEAAGATFHVLAGTGQIDDMCRSCRFDAIDAKYDSLDALREDMRSYDIPLRSEGYHSKRNRGKI